MKIFVKSALVLLAIGGTIWGYTHEVPFFSNTFDSQYLFFRALLLGAVIGVFVGRYFSKKATDASDRVPIFMICLVACMAILPLKALFINHFLAINAPLSIKVIFEKEEALRTSRFGIAKNSTVAVDAFYIYFIKNGKVERIRSRTQSFRTLERGQEIELPVKKGFFGFDFVDIP